MKNLFRYLFLINLILFFEFTGCSLSDKTETSASTFSEEENGEEEETEINNSAEDVYPQGSDAIGNITSNVTEINEPSITGVLKGANEKNTKEVPVQDAQICLETHPKVACVKSDKEGKFFLTGFPMNENVYLVIKKTGYLPVGYSIFTSSEYLELESPMLIKEKELTSIAEKSLELAVNLKKGIVLLRILKEQAPAGARKGAVFKLSPSTGDGPYYIVDKGVDKKLTETGEQGGAVVVNVEPGEINVEIIHTAFKCTPEFSWPVKDKEDSGKIKVKGGYVEIIDVYCFPK